MLFWLLFPALLTASTGPTTSTMWVTVTHQTPATHRRRETQTVKEVVRKTETVEVPVSTLVFVPVTRTVNDIEYVDKMRYDETTRYILEQVVTVTSYVRTTATEDIYMTGVTETVQSVVERMRTSTHVYTQVRVTTVISLIYTS
ncbi:MAG: uncharacterized protein A8A55_1206 [Amphiamblys sp. WSBS2006]|nr:MAG: uncharacterized protein A8A55_1206 [Amphiamblys sp. WSBS2006]